jgi:hypothetical protein
MFWTIIKNNKRFQLPSKSVIIDRENNTITLDTEVKYDTFVYKDVHFIISLEDKTDEDYYETVCLYVDPYKGYSDDLFLNIDVAFSSEYYIESIIFKGETKWTCNDLLKIVKSLVVSLNKGYNMLLKDNYDLIEVLDASNNKNWKQILSKMDETLLTNDDAIQYLSKVKKVEIEDPCLFFKDIKLNIHINSHTDGFVRIPLSQNKLKKLLEKIKTDFGNSLERNIDIYNCYLDVLKKSKTLGKLFVFEFRYWLSRRSILDSEDKKSYIMLDHELHNTMKSIYEEDSICTDEEDRSEENKSEEDEVYNFKKEKAPEKTRY